jgi:hypothetical protein
MTSHVEEQIKARIAAAKRRDQDMRRKRAELAAARAAGLARRNAARLRHQAEHDADNPGVMTSPEETPPS